MDSVHALAFVPTPRLFFNTRYSLPCICDWQDQALLLTYFGVARAQLFRERLGIRGALDAQRLAQRLVESVRPATPTAETDLEAPVPCQLLGFGSLNEARVALWTLLDDTVLERLRVFYEATPKTDDSEIKQTADP